jgi:hypothetical protein
MKSMMAGYIIRKCRICKQYFMLKKAYHAMYCDKPSPVDARYTCHQIGSFKVEKELAGNIPKVGSKIRTYDRIEQDRRRGIITHKEERKLKDEVRDLLHEALTSPKISNDDFENMVQSEILYPKYNIVRKTKPRGRPKKQ